MTFRLPVNKTMPLYDVILVLEQNFLVQNFQRSKLPFCDACFFATKTKDNQTKVNNVYLNYSVVA